MKILQIGLFLIGFIATTLAQGEEAEVFYHNEKEVAYFRHEVKPKETLYALSKTYGVPVTHLLTVNKLKSPALSLGQVLIVPFDNSAIQYNAPVVDKSSYVQVFYRVKRKETAYRICRSYLKVNLTAIKELNDLRRNSLAIDQKLKIGYIRTYVPHDVAPPIAKSTVPKLEPTVDVTVMQHPTTQPDIEPLRQPAVDNRTYSINYDNGAAFWNKEAAGLNGYFVLHRFAERNTWIEVTNPMYNNSVQAKVIGNIPDTGYPSDILIVVSPSIAKDLGALDERFYVKVRYLRAQTQLTKGK